MKLLIEYVDMPDVQNEAPIEVVSIEEGIAKAHEEYLSYLKVNNFSVDEYPKFEWDGKGVYEIGGRWYSFLLEKGTRVKHRFYDMIGTIIMVSTIGEKENLNKGDELLNVPIYYILWDGRPSLEHCDYNGIEHCNKVEEISNEYVMGFNKYFALPLSDGTICEIGIMVECETFVDLFPAGFRLPNVGDPKKQEAEAIEYLEKKGLIKEVWYRDSGGTGLMQWSSDTDGLNQQDAHALVINVISLLKLELKEIEGTPV